MPTYEYACKACGHRLEAVQKFTDDALTECPECGGPLRKVFAAPGIVLKGSGFYKTDTRAQDKRSGSGGSGASNGSETKSDAKAAPGSKPDGAGKTASGTDSSPSPAAGSGPAAKESKPAASTAS